MNKFVSFSTVAVIAFLFMTTPAVAQNIQVSDLLGTVWESTKYGNSYKDKTIEQLQFIGTEHARMVSAMYLDGRFISDAAVVYRYSIVNSSTIRVHFTAVTDKGKYVESFYDFRLENEAGNYSFVDVTEHYSTHKEPFKWLSCKLPWEGGSSLAPSIPGELLAHRWKEIKFAACHKRCNFTPLKQQVHGSRNHSRRS